MAKFQIKKISKSQPSSAAITINGCCTTDQACPECPTSAHGKRSTSLRSPSARLPTSLGCILCRPPSPRRSRSCYSSSLYQVWPWGCVAHSGRNPQIASFAERGSPPTAGWTSSWLAVLVASNAGPTEGLRTPCFDGSVFVGVSRMQKWGRVLVLAASRECSACYTPKENPWRRCSKGLENGYGRPWLMLAFQFPVPTLSKCYDITNLLCFTSRNQS